MIVDYGTPKTRGVQKDYGEIDQVLPYSSIVTNSVFQVRLLLLFFLVFVSILLLSKG